MNILLSLKIGYFADGPWSHETLDKFLDDPFLEIKFICARYENPDPVLKNKALLHNIDFYTSNNINSEDFLNKISKYNCDIFVSMSFNQIMKKSFFNLPRLGTINCHAGKLPLYRGRNVLNWALINDEKEFGITVHYIDEGIDTGDIICQKVFPITDLDTYKTLLEKSYIECPIILLEAINLIKNGQAKRITQNSISKNGMYCSRRRKGDEIIDWNQKSRDIFNFVRALTTPGPCAISYIEDHSIKIISVCLIKNAPIYKGIPGAIISLNSDYLILKTKDSYIKVTEFNSPITLKIGMRFTK